MACFRENTSRMKGCESRPMNSAREPLLMIVHSRNIADDSFRMESTGGFTRMQIRWFGRTLTPVGAMPTISLSREGAARR